MEELLDALHALHSEFTVTSGSCWLPEWTSHISISENRPP